jgi:hypothetical protein
VSQHELGLEVVPAAAIDDDRGIGRQTVLPNVIGRPTADEVRSAEHRLRVLTFSGEVVLALAGTEVLEMSVIEVKHLLRAYTKLQPQYLSLLLGLQPLEDDMLVIDMLASTFPEIAEITLVQSNSDGARLSRFDGRWELVMDPNVSRAWSVPYVSTLGWLRSFTVENGAVTIGDPLGRERTFPLHTDEYSISLEGGTLQIMDGDLLRTGPTGFIHRFRRQA